MANIINCTVNVIKYENSNIIGIFGDLNEQDGETLLQLGRGKESTAGGLKYILRKAANNEEGDYIPKIELALWDVKDIGIIEMKNHINEMKKKIEKLEEKIQKEYSLIITAIPKMSTE